MENNISRRSLAGLLTFSHSFGFHKSTFSEKNNNTINAAAQAILLSVFSFCLLTPFKSRYLSGLGVLFYCYCSPEVFFSFFKLILHKAMQSVIVTFLLHIIWSPLANEILFNRFSFLLVIDWNFTKLFFIISLCAAVAKSPNLNCWRTPTATRASVNFLANFYLCDQLRAAEKS